MTRPLGIGKKGIVYRDQASHWLMKLSKAALADCVIDLLRTSGYSESIDDPITKDAAIDRLTPVLRLRGDRIPK